MEPSRTKTTNPALIQRVLRTAAPLQMAKYCPQNILEMALKFSPPTSHNNLTQTGQMPPNELDAKEVLCCAPFEQLAEFCNHETLKEAAQLKTLFYAHWHLAVDWHHKEEGGYFATACENTITTTDSRIIEMQENGQLGKLLGKYATDARSSLRKHPSFDPEKKGEIPPDSLGVVEVQGEEAIKWFKRFLTEYNKLDDNLLKNNPPPPDFSR